MLRKYQFSPSFATTHFSEIRNSLTMFQQRKNTKVISLFPFSTLFHDLSNMHYFYGWGLRWNKISYEKLVYFTRNVCRENRRKLNSFNWEFHNQCNFLLLVWIILCRPRETIKDIEEQLHYLFTLITALNIIFQIWKISTQKTKKICIILNSKGCTKIHARSNLYKIHRCFSKKNCDFIIYS